ncbi:MAG: hypothetical protein U0164_11000 [Gemmatimonadaceae bacterium]
MILEIREVSRKTPRDGRLEISAETARRLSPFGGTITAEVGAMRDTATIEAMPCQCAKGGGETGHTHHFLKAAPFTTLAAGETVVLELLEGPVVAVARPHPLAPSE